MKNDILEYYLGYFLLLFAADGFYFQIQQKNVDPDPQQWLKVLCPLPGGFYVATSVFIVSCFNPKHIGVKYWGRGAL